MPSPRQSKGPLQIERVLGKLWNVTRAVGRISHEDIPCNWRVTVLGELWPSFRKPAKFVLSGADSHIYYEKPSS